jgi:hypothetical protein
MKLPQLTYLYILYATQPSFPFISILHIGRYKIGISNDIKRRCREIQDSIWEECRKDVRVRPLIYVPLFTAYNREQWLHRKLSFCHAKDMPGSGGTEWFWGLNIATPITLYLTALYFGLDWPFVSWIWVLLCPLPFDFVLFAVLIFLAESTLVVGTFLTLIFLTYQFF